MRKLGEAGEGGARLVRAWEGVWYGTGDSVAGQGFDEESQEEEGRGKVHRARLAAQAAAGVVAGAPAWPAATTSAARRRPGATWSRECR